MSRQIDLTKPLSDEDRQYLVDRCMWDELREAGQNVPPDRDPNSTPPSVDTPTTLYPTDTGTLTAELPTKPLPDVSMPAQPEPEAGEGEEKDNYDDADVWSYADLQDEAKSREPAISAKGSREEVIARLREDDQTDKG